MTDKELQQLKNALNNEYAFKTILTILIKLGAFERGIPHDISDREVFITMGRREKGLWLLDQIYAASPKKYAELLQEKEKI